jgi:hypothetical protein
MGYYSGYATLKGLIHDLTHERHHVNQETGHESRFLTLAKCFRGNIQHKGTLWAVHQHVYRNGPQDEWQLTPPFIGCYTIDYANDKRDASWGYRAMDESVGPFVYNCPLKYLGMTPEVDPAWRAAVRAYAATVTERLAKKRAARALRRKTHAS